MTRLSVNVNKIATLRNARGGSAPNLVQVAIDAQKFGAQGITIHPRPDERHIRYQDAFDLKPVVHTEFNIEGNPQAKFLDLIEQIRPDQVTLVPDADDAITSNAGWDTVKNRSKLSDIITHCKSLGVRTSIFVAPELAMIEGAADCGTDRIELYTEAYAHGFLQNAEAAVQPYRAAAERAYEVGLGINAGHDFSLKNIEYFAANIPNLAEVSIGHALICESLYQGLEPVIQLYLKKLAQ